MLLHRRRARRRQGGPRRGGRRRALEERPARRARGTLFCAAFEPRSGVRSGTGRAGDRRAAPALLRPGDRGGGLDHAAGEPLEERRRGSLARPRRGPPRRVPHRAGVAARGAKELLEAARRSAVRRRRGGRPEHAARSTRPAASSPPSSRVTPDGVSTIRWRRGRPASGVRLLRLAREEERLEVVDRQARGSWSSTPSRRVVAEWPRRSRARPEGRPRGSSMDWGFGELLDGSRFSRYSCLRTQ